MPDTERQIEFVTGSVAGITQKGPEKWVVEVTVLGSQYPRRLWTKSEAQHAAATALLGQQATFECGASEYERDGKMVRSLWINAVNPGTPPPQEPPGAEEAVAAVAQEVTGATESAQKPPPGPQDVVEVYAPTAPPRDPFGDPTRASIERQVALKCAVQFWTQGGNVNEPMVSTKLVLETAEAFDQFLARVVPF